MRILALQGNIGCGKSSVLRLVSDRVHVIPEPIADWGAWLTLFYDAMRQPGKNVRSFGFQLQVLLSFARALRDVPAGTQVVVVERSPQSSRDVFVDMAHQQGDIDEHELRVYEQLFDELTWRPITNVYLRCPAATCYARVQERQRKAEESVPLSYLEKLHVRHEALYYTEKSTDDDEVHVLDATQTPEVLAKQLLALVHAE